MVFRINVCAEVYAEECNICLEFPAFPSMAALIAATEAEFSTLSRNCRPSGFPCVPFRVQLFRVYDDSLRRWVDLQSVSRLPLLADYTCRGSFECQLSAIQRENPLSMCDEQIEVPPESFETGLVLSHGPGIPSQPLPWDLACVPPVSIHDKLHVAFLEMDTGNRGHLHYSDARDAFERRGMDFSTAMVGGLFSQAYAGKVTYEEWVEFAVSRPAMVDVLVNKTPCTPSTGHDAARKIRRAREMEVSRLKIESMVAAEDARVQGEFEASIAQSRAEATTAATLARARAEAAAAEQTYMEEQYRLAQLVSAEALSRVQVADTRKSAAADSLSLTRRRARLARRPLDRL